MNKVLHTVIRVLIVLGMILGIGLIVCIIMPTSNFPGGRLFFEVNGSGWRGYVSGGLAIVSILGCETIGVVLFSMMQSLSKDPFVEENVKRLRIMGFVALGVMVCAFLTLAFEAVPLLVVGALPVGMCGMFSLTLAEVFQKAVEAKRENDLTI